MTNERIIIDIKEYLKYGIFFRNELNKLSNINHNLKLIFIHIPKTAGTSIRAAFKLNGRINHSLPHQLVTKRLWKDYFTFCVIRNPYERLVSSYRYHTSADYDGWHLKNHPDLKSLNIEQYFERMKYTEALLPQFHFTYHKFSKKPIDKICRFEKLNEDIQQVAQILQLKEYHLPYLKTSSHSHYRSYYTNRFKTRIDQFYKKDIEAFHYQF